MLKVVFLVSGGLGLKVLTEAHQQHEIVAVLTDSQSTSIISFCKDAEIACFAGNPRKGRATDFIQNIQCDVLFSVNYLFIIEKDLISLPRKYAINIHGSLLPKYRGRTPHVWAIINGEVTTGITAHLIDDEVDNGGIVKQRVVEIGPDDTGAMVLGKFNHIYPEMVEEVLTEIRENRLTIREQDVKKATYFGKRTPESGKVEWSWFKERIRNWIRAQASPYPGAFAFYEGKKILLHKSEFSDLGFTKEMENGLILAIDGGSLFVKTSNGVLKISEIEVDTTINFEVNKVLK